MSLKLTINCIKLLMLLMIVSGGKCKEKKEGKENDVKISSLELFYQAPKLPNGEMHIWKTIIQVSDTNGVITKFLDQYANDAKDTQIRVLGQTTSVNFDYLTHFSTLIVAPDCNTNTEDYHRFLISKDNQLSELGKFVSKQGHFPPPFKGNSSRSELREQVNLSDEYDLSIIKVNRNGLDLELNCQLRDGKLIKEMQVETLDIGGKKFYAVRLIKSSDSLLNIENNFTKTIKNYVSLQPIIIFFSGDEMTLDFNKHCIVKEAMFSLL